MKHSDNGFDYDWIIIGSGFGGSVSALRLAEKGYKVAVLERGRRFADDGFAKSTWDLRNWLWAPMLGLRGIFRLTPFKDVFIASGAGVGGGSLVYANTLYRAAPAFFDNPQWAGLADWATALSPHYDVAERMLGVKQVPFESDGQRLLKQVADGMGVSETFRQTPCGVFFGEPDKEVPDPYFGGEGPARTGCTRCGACMIGCRVGAKNTLVKNYLWFAEKRGVEIIAEREASDVRPLGGTDGADGYVVSTQHPGAWWRKRRRDFTARGVIFAAGALGTNQLLANCKHAGSLPKISDRLGSLVRTNSESILAVTLPTDTDLEPWRDVAISGSIHPEPDTHIEFVTYGEHGDAMNLLFTRMVGDGTRLTRPLKLSGRDRPPPDHVPEDPVAVWLVAPFRHVPGDAEPGQRYLFHRQAAVVWLGGQAVDPAGSREAKPDVYPGGQPGGAVAGNQNRWRRPGHDPRGAGEYSDHRAHPRRCADRPGCRERRRRQTKPGVRLSEPAGV